MATITGLYLYPMMRYRIDQRAGGATFGQNIVIAQGQGKTLRVGQQLAERWNF